MLSTALHTLRTRWATFVGGFTALSLGVALITVMGLALASAADTPERRPQRFAAAPVVVQGQDTLTVPTPVGDRTHRLARPRPVPAATVTKLRRLGTVVQDRSFPVHTAHGPAGLVGHPWSTAAYAPYELRTGRAPKAPDEVVVSGDRTRQGTRIRTTTGTVRVVGTVTTTGSENFEDAVFYTDTRAAELSPHSPRLVVEADPAAVRAAVGADAGVQVLTGDARRHADPDPDRDSRELTAMNALFGTAGGVSAFVSVFVVASTSAYSVAQRRREFGLLRTAGATPGQIRRTVTLEALTVGALASATGCALGSLGAPRLAAWAVTEHLAPRWFTIGDHTWPYHLAFWTGLLAALCGVTAASWRAGRTAPTEALREAAADTRVMTRGRLLLGTALLLTAAVTLALALATDPGELLRRKTYTTRPMLLITATALLAPLLVRPLTRLLTWLPARLPGAAGMLVRENTATGARRTAAVAAPVLITVALAGSLLGATATIDGAKAAEARARTTADLVITPAGPDGFDPATLRRLRAVPGVEISPSASSAVYALEDGTALVRSAATAAEPGPLAATTRIPLTAGRLTDLDDDSIVVNTEWQQHTVGERIDVWLGDGTRKNLEIAAVMPTGTGDNGVLLTPRNAPGAPADRIDARLTDGTDPATAATALRRAVHPTGGTVRTGDAWLRATHPEAARTTRAGFLLVLGIALLYTGISMAATTAMATTDRVRELAALRLAGATGRQVLRLVAAEALTVVAVGALLGTLVAALGLLGMHGALALLSVPAPLAMPWAVLATVTGACAVLATVSALVPAALALRRGAARSAGVRE
ncbi:FtsX-like permease family protein [Streptomyces sp. NPDC057499]|uniref:FtsX-like permease family protein n=1 Tax=Streptomyces sp. NPDC057499 TaxID=3346150 RepID=UPI003684E534